MTTYYLNEDKTYRPATLKEWVDQLGSINISLCVDNIEGNRVSTVWLGFDTGLFKDKPQVFETMIFFKEQKEGEGYCVRHSSWEEAKIGHKRAIQWLKMKLKKEGEIIRKICSIDTLPYPHLLIREYGDNNE